jgi:Response regulators consisting of a CheY-like receiver domain and a winged-helix DNA-binding domain
VHLLVVEDDARLSRLLKRLLSQDRHVVETALTAEEGLEVATSDLELDAIVLDVGLPDRSGFDVARTLRKKGSQVPILMLTARDSVSDRVEGLDAGADDYLVKPFAYEELLARLRALGRRPPTRKSPVLKAGPIELDETTRRVAVSGKSVDLSQREFSILECLLRRPGQVLSRDQLLDYAWPYGVALTPNTVEAYIHLLREKLGADGALHVETVRGVGYRLREG